MAALALARETCVRGQVAVEAMLGLPLIVPDIVAAMLHPALFVLVGIELCLISVMVAHTVFRHPARLPADPRRLEGLDPSLAEAAADLFTPTVGQSSAASSSR